MSPEWIGDYTRKDSIEKVPETGSYVGGVVVFTRHGVREKTGELKNEGRIRTREIMNDLARRPGSVLSIAVDKIHVVGSNAGPKGPTGQERSLETAHIVGEELSKAARGEYDQNARVAPRLSYETVSIDIEKVYAHTKIYDDTYDAALARGLDVPVAAQAAQDAALDAAFSVQSMEADAMRKEMAGAFAAFLEEFKTKLKAAKNGSTITVPAGTHGGVMEYLLQQAVEWDDASGKHFGPGFTSIKEIGGAFAASESYAVWTDTDKFGNFSEMIIEFQDKDRRKGMYNLRLNSQKVSELAEYYKGVHSKVPQSGLEDLVS